MYGEYGDQEVGDILKRGNRELLGVAFEECGKLFFASYLGQKCHKSLYNSFHILWTSFWGWNSYSKCFSYSDIICHFQEAHAIWLLSVILPFDLPIMSILSISKFVAKLQSTRLHFIQDQSGSTVSAILYELPSFINILRYNTIMRKLG